MADLGLDLDFGRGLSLSLDSRRGLDYGTGVVDQGMTWYRSKLGKLGEFRVGVKVLMASGPAVASNGSPMARMDIGSNPSQLWISLAARCSLLGLEISRAAAWKLPDGVGGKPELASPQRCKRIHRSCKISTTDGLMMRPSEIGRSYLLMQ